jgi:hypothetical protein
MRAKFGIADVARKRNAAFAVCLHGALRLLRVLRFVQITEGNVRAFHSCRNGDRPPDT